MSQQFYFVLGCNPRSGGSTTNVCERRRARRSEDVEVFVFGFLLSPLDHLRGSFSDGSIPNYRSKFLK